MSDSQARNPRESKANAVGLANRPWYKEPMMWVVLGLPAIVVVAGFVTLYIAASRPETLVSAPHTKIGFTVEKIAPEKAAESR